MFNDDMREGLREVFKIGKGILILRRKKKSNVFYDTVLI